jgi:hypothetical protein
VTVEASLPTPVLQNAQYSNRVNLDRIFMFGLIQYNFCQEPQQLAFDLLAHKNHIL